MSAPLRFRFDPTRVVAQAVGVSTVGLLTMFGVGAGAGLIALPPPAAWGIAGGQSVVFGLLLGLLFRLSAVRVGPDGVAQVGPWGGGRVVGWDAIRRAEVKHLLLVPRLLLYGPGRPTPLPLTLADPHGFADAVSEFAGPDHPLTVAVRDWLAGD